MPIAYAFLFRRRVSSSEARIFSSGLSIDHVVGPAGLHDHRGGAGAPCAQQAHHTAGGARPALGAGSAECRGQGAGCRAQGGAARGLARGKAAQRKSPCPAEVHPTHNA